MAQGGKREFHFKSTSPWFSVCIILFFTNFTRMWAHQVLDFSFKLPTCTWICHKITNAVKCNLTIKLTTKSTFYFRSAVPVFMWYCMLSALQLCTDQCVQAWQLLVHFGRRIVMSSFLHILVYSLTSFNPIPPTLPVSSVNPVWWVLGKLKGAQKAAWGLMDGLWRLPAIGHYTNVGWSQWRSLDIPGTHLPYSTGLIILIVST